MGIESKFVGQHCIVRTESAGVFAGTIQKIESSAAIVTDARRIWYWSGAATLSQLAIDGTSNPAGCKFPAPVPEVLLIGVIEVIPTSVAARESIDGVPAWRE